MSNFNTVEEIQTISKLKVNANAKATYLALMLIAGERDQFGATFNELQMNTSISRSSLIRGMADLEEVGLITVVRDQKRGDETNPNQYILNYRKQGWCQPGTTGSVNLTPPNGNISGVNLTPYKDINNKNTTTTTSTSHMGSNPDTGGVKPPVSGWNPMDGNKKKKNNPGKGCQPGTTALSSQQQLFLCDLSEETGYLIDIRSREIFDKVRRVAKFMDKDSLTEYLKQNNSRANDAGMHEVLDDLIEQHEARSKP